MVLLLGLCIVLLSGFVSAEISWSDTFDRGDSATIGNGWTEGGSNGWTIESKTLYAPSSSGTIERTDQDLSAVGVACVKINISTLVDNIGFKPDAGKWVDWYYQAHGWQVYDSGGWSYCGNTKGQVAGDWICRNMTTPYTTYFYNSTSETTSSLCDNANPRNERSLDSIYFDTGATVGSRYDSVCLADEINDCTTQTPTPEITQTVDIISPVNNTHSNNNNLTVNFNTTISSATCDLNLNSTFNTSKTYDNSGNDSFSISLSEGTHTFSVNCSNVTDNQTSKVYTYFKDTINPQIIDNLNLNNTNVVTPQTQVNITIGPDYLYKAYVNVTCGNGTNIYSQEYNYSGEYRSDTLTDTITNSLCNNVDNITVLVEVADTHTAKFIDVIKHSIFNKEIRFNDGVKIYPLNKNDFTTVSTKKEFDRHTFDFKRRNSGVKYDYFYLEGRNLDYIQEGQYENLGHFIDWNGFGGKSHWIDFNTDEKYPISVLRVDDEKYRIKIDCSKDGCSRDYNFKSLGGLNENNLTIEYFYFGTMLNLTESFDSELLESDENNFYVNISFNTLTYLNLNNVILEWNSTNYSANLFEKGILTYPLNYSNYNYSLPISISSTENISHKWYINLTYLNGTERIEQTTPSYQTLYDINIYNCTKSDNNSTIQFTINDETTNTEMSGNLLVTFDLYLSNTNYNEEFSFDIMGTSNQTFCISPNASGEELSGRSFTLSGQIETSSTDYITRGYWLTNTTLTTNVREIDLFLLNSSLSTNIIVTVYDEDGYTVQDQELIVQRYNVGTGEYQSVESLITDYKGQALSQVVLYTVWYTHTLKKDGIFSIVKGYTNPTTPALQFTTNLEFTVINEEDIFLQYNNINSVRGASTLSETATGYKFQYSDPSNTIDQAILTIYEVSDGGSSIFNQTTSTATTGTLLIPFVNGNITDNKVYHISAAVKYNSNQSTEVIDTIEVNNQTRFAFGLDGVLAALFLVAAFGLVGYFNPAICILLSTTGLVISVLAGFVYMSLGSVVSIIIAVLFLLWKMRA